MKDTLVAYLRRTALDEIPVEREPDRGREIVDLLEDAQDTRAGPQPDRRGRKREK